MTTTSIMRSITETITPTRIEASAAKNYPRDDVPAETEIAMPGVWSNGP